MQNSLLTASHDFEARFRAAFQSSAIGMGLLSLEGRIIQVNDAVLKMSGYTEEELYQRCDHENTFPEDRDVGMDLFQELLDGKRDWYQVEKRYVRKNGEVFWARLTLSAVRDSQGKALYLVGLVDDIDVQKKALEDLWKSEARFRVMFESAGIGIALVGMDRRPLEANDAIIQMTGYSPQEFFQMTGAELSFPEDAEIGMPELKAVLEGKLNTYQIEKRYVRKGARK
jgi:PAS domain S-box-containing protein